MLFWLPRPSAGAFFLAKEDCFSAALKAFPPIQLFRSGYLSKKKFQKKSCKNS